MDAQNAVEPASTKPAASPKRPGSDAEQQKSSAPAVTKLSSIAKPDLPPKDSSNRPSALGSGSGSGTHATPADDDATAADANSDAETIVLPGKDGHSPSKVRKIIKHEEKSDGEDIQPPPAPSLLSRKQSNMKQDRQERLDRDGGADRNDRGDRSGDKAAAAAARSASSTRNGPNANAPPNESGAPSLASKKKKQHLETKAKIKDGSNGLSSAPTSPPQRRRRSSIAQQSKSDSETGPVDSPKSSVKDKDRPLNKAGDKSDKGDKSVPHKRKAPRPDSDDEAENRKIRRQRISGSGLDASRKQQQQPHQTAKPHHEAHSATRTRSASPLPRPHRRSTSTQLPGHPSNGLSQKKKRVPAPLQSTDYPSDESSASGSPHPRSSKLRSLATPATAESTISPAKMAPHKKHLDAHGQTFLARACAKGEYDIAKTRLQERPEDINVADYAGNTPLQIAALNGYDDIVKLLVDAGCNLDCVNNDRDTPLLDAVENGHLEVVNILLDAGVNPRKANAYGQEPIVRVNDELDHADEIRQALINAKKKMGERRRTSEEHQPDHNDAVSSRGLGSPRRSPGVSSSLHGGGGRRAGTVRATKTSNHLLYMPMDDKTLREAAARGDEETVTRILQVREAFDDPESMVAAARGGHEMVMQLLLALGKANPDPSPIATPDGNTEYATPILAAIGQENIKIIRLLLDQADFDPTKRYKGETYFEIARRRQGANWIEEEEMLKDAYDEYKKSHKDISKNRSPNRREQDKESRRNRAEPKEPKDEVARSHKRKASSPSREPKKSTATKIAASPRGEKRRSDSFTTHQDDQTSPKRGPGRPKKDDRSIPLIAISDREASPAAKPTSKAKRAESDLAAASSEGETVKPRRKLISARELKDKREKQQRRASLTSNASSVMKEPSSPRDEPEKTPKTEKYHDRTKALKRDESRDRLSVSGDATGKRHRSSATPPIGSVEKEAGEGPIKRRRLEGESKERRLKPSQSDDRLLKAPTSREGGSSPAAASRMSSKTRENEDRRPTPKPRKMEGQTENAWRESPSVPVKSEDQDVEMLDADQSGMDAVESRALQQRKKEEHEKKKQAEAEAAAREHKKKEDERKRKEEEEREREKERLRAEDIKRHAEAEARRRAEEEQRRKEEEESKRKEEDEQRKKREDEQRKQKELEERRRAEEERKRQEEEERKLREEAERKQREEEERLHREQLEREAAEEARRKEEERKEHAAREEERRRAAREAEARRLREQEERRLARLPALLRWLETAVNPKVPEVAEKFSTIQGVRFDCIRPEANGTPEGREQWLLNTQVALLLGEKDLELSRCTSLPKTPFLLHFPLTRFLLDTAWARVPASPTAKEAIWRLEADRYALTTSSLYELGKQIPDYYPDNEPDYMSYPVRERLRSDAWEKFSALDMFFVKVRREGPAKILEKF